VDALPLACTHRLVKPQAIRGVGFSSYQTFMEAPNALAKDERVFVFARMANENVPGLFLFAN
jgi:hypothetical protein